MQIAVKTAAFAVRLPGTSHSRHWPKDVKLELSNTGHTGPWSLAAEIQFFGTDRWQFFEIPTFAIGYRYARLFVVGSYVSGYNARISEVEFFQNVVGTRVSPAVHKSSLPRGAVAGVSATDQCSVDSSNRQTYGCSRLSVWPVVAKNQDAWGCDAGSVTYTSYYGHHADRVCECADGWLAVHIPAGTSYGYGKVMTCIRI